MRITTGWSKNTGRDEETTGRSKNFRERCKSKKAKKFEEGG
jgi:hypothetical protein